MSLLDEVKRRVDITQLVSEYVDLNTSSRTPKALCPFHSENTPSFVVYPERGSWYCFGGCATGGDAVSFVMKQENLSFSDALFSLARKYGIEASRDSGRVLRAKTTVRLRRTRLRQTTSRHC